MTLITLRIWLALMLCFIVEQAMTATLTDINIANSTNQSTITLDFNEKPIYTFFSLHNPERMVVDIYQSSPVQGLPFYFNGENVIKRIRTSTPVNKKKSLRLVCDLTRQSGTQAETRQVRGRYNVVFTVTSQPRLVVASRSRISTAMPSLTPPVVVAIDAGHGGQDPGAIGPNGLHEKNVTIAIARKLKALLDKDLMFKPVLTRDENYFISVMGRSDVARKNGASVLISIHADAAPNRSASGASVWVLSNRRANSEMANWLEQNEKQSELLGGAGDLLIKSQADPYLSQAVLDLQFGHSQRVGYDIAVKVLSQLRRIGALHKRRPEHASLGVLRSPDIPSLLVETGFISNTQEERLLGSSAYQDEIANALYLGLRNYFLVHPLQMSKKLENRSQGVSSETHVKANRTLAVVQSQSAILESSNARHTVVHGETLFGITRQYSISMTSLRALNNLKKDSVWVGQRLRIPSTGRLIYPPYAAPRATMRRHKVARGDTLISIAARYDISAGTIRKANKMKRNSVILGQTLTIPHT